MRHGIAAMYNGDIEIDCIVGHIMMERSIAMHLAQNALKTGVFLWTLFSLGAGVVQAQLGVISPPAVLNTNAATDTAEDYAQQVATDGQGHWVAVWQSGDMSVGDYDILVVRSSDNGVTWTSSVPLNTNAAGDIGDDASPQITTDGQGHWVAVWQSYDTLGGTIGGEGDILVALSSDNGATWTAPAPLNTNAATDHGWDDHPQVTTDKQGHWVAVWESTDTLGGAMGGEGDIIVAHSTDNGATWSVPAPLNTNAATDSGGDWAPQVTTDVQGHWVAVWESNNTLGGTIGSDYDTFVARSTDNGGTWTAPAPLNGNAVTESRDDLFPQVATDGQGHWVAVWSSYNALGGTIGLDTDIHLARSNDNGATWSPPAALNTNATTDTGADGAPQITADGHGYWVSVWESRNILGGTMGPDSDIHVACSRDNGVTWTAPAALNTNATTDSGDDYGPHVATDKQWHWVAVWSSNTILGGTCGTEWDIFGAHFIVPDCNGNDILDWGESDRDGDGTIDACDGCPDDASKIPPGVCGCGVLDVDSDGDGVPDCIDNCLDTPNVDQSDQNGDGTGDACEAPPAAQSGCGGCGAARVPLAPLTLLSLAWMKRRHRGG
jgi:hypothetical protein